jgi:hypothetical protein
MRSGLILFCQLLALTGVLLGQDPAPPLVKEQPVGVSAYVGDIVTLQATVEGSPPLQFQWYRDGVPVPGATSPTYLLASATLADTALYQLVISNAVGTTYATGVVIIVNKRPQVLSFSPATTTAIAGTSIALSATSSAGLPVSLTLVSGAGSLNGTTLTGLGGSVVVRATQPGNDSVAPAELVERTFSFVSGSLSPFITSAPPDQAVVGGTAVTFRAAAIGTPAPAYQWKKDGNALAGATNPALVLAAATVADAGRYTVTATNASGSASATATLVVHIPPAIIDSPASRTVFAGDSVSLTVGATGVPAPTYQWKKNGVVIAGATRATLAFASALATNAGRYEAVVTNLLGTVTTPAFTLTVATRDFSGTYFGRSSDGAGDFALLVRPDRTAVFLGYFPGLQTAVVTPNLNIELSGNFSLGLSTIASADGGPGVLAGPAAAAAPQAVTLQGRLNDATATASLQLPELGVTLAGSRVPASGSGNANAGFYRIGLIGTAAGGYGIVAPDGQALILTASGALLDAAQGTLDATGRLAVTTSSQATVNLRFTDGVLSGTVGTASGVVGTLGGAVEERAASLRLVNLSVRALTTPGATALITGFVVSGSTAKQVLIRAAGPALVSAPFNVADAVADPTIQLFRGSNVVGQNDDWGAPAANAAPITAAATRVGAFPFRAGSNDAALLATLSPGPYTVSIGGGNGTVLAEVYEVLANNEVAGTRRLVNLSARGIVTATSPLIAGFVVSGNAPQLVLIRGIGPTLGAPPFSVAGALPNPRLTVFQGTTVVKTNDDWFRDPEAGLVRAAAIRAGAFALGASSLDAAGLVYLAPGAYTAQVSGPQNANQANANGLAMVEIYEVNP